MNVPDPDEKILHGLNLLLYEFLFDDKYDKIKVSVVCQDPAAGLGVFYVTKGKIKCIPSTLDDFVSEYVR